MNQEYGLLVIAVKLKWVAWDRSTNYGCPMRPFFNDIPNFLGRLANKFGGIFGWTSSSHLGTVSPLSMISIIHNFFPKILCFSDLLSKCGIGRKEFRKSCVSSRWTGPSDYVPLLHKKLLSQCNREKLDVLDFRVDMVKMFTIEMLGWNLDSRSPRFSKWYGNYSVFSVKLYLFSMSK